MPLIDIVRFDNDPHETVNGIRKDTSSRGVDLEGALITAKYIDGSAEILTWRAFDSYTYGGAVGTEIDMSFGFEWHELSTTKPLASLQIDLQPASSAFDTTLDHDDYPVGNSTSGSLNGYPFKLAPEFDDFSGDLTVTYSGIVNLAGSQAVGDLYTTIIIDFSKLPMGGLLGDLRWNSDIDTMRDAGDLAPISQGSDTLLGTSGNDTFHGGLGADTMEGGAGDDTYTVDNIGDLVIEIAGGGIDMVHASVSYALADDVENLVLTGNDPLNGTGNELNNRLTGNAGSNFLDGGLGADTMEGGAGDDTYTVDNIGDLVIETAGGGIDTAHASVSYALADEVESLVLNGSGALNGTGNELNNRLTGSAGSNFLDGGLGADTLEGSGGDDTYTVDNIGDGVLEAAGGGTDTVRTTVSYTLSANVENLVLNGSGHLTGNGNGLANRVLGNAGNNIFNGGLGADTLIGGAGDDIYIVDNIGDRVVEAAGGGTDTVRTIVSYTLSANVENLVLGGGAHLNGSGNALANRLTGNAGNNVLNGGIGADTMIGGAGNDTYIVDSIGDRVIEAAGRGTDAVRASVSHTLAAHVENLVLTGTGHLNGSGNGLANRLTGNIGNNVLGGGQGVDTLIGNAGNDSLFGGAAMTGSWVGLVLTSCSEVRGTTCWTEALALIPSTVDWVATPSSAVLEMTDFWAA